MRHELHRRVPHPECGESLTHQSFRDESDINNIVRKFLSTGRIDHLAKTPPQHMNTADMPDFKTAMDNITAAKQYFAHLPPSTRRQFGNSFDRFLEAYDAGDVLGVDETSPPPSDESEAPKAASGESDEASGEAARQQHTTST